MKHRLKAIIDSWITSIMGVIVYTITTTFIWRGTFDFLWEGVAGYVVGTALLLFPKSIETFILAWLKNRQSTNCDSSAKPDTPDGD